MSEMIDEKVITPLEEGFASTLFEVIYSSEVKTCKFLQFHPLFLYDFTIIKEREENGTNGGITPFTSLSKEFKISNNGIGDLKKSRAS